MVNVIDKAAFWLLTATAVLAPIPFGSNDPQSAALMGLMVSACLLGAPFVPPCGSKARGLINATLLLAAIIVTWAVVQVIPGTPDAWGHPVWSEARPFIENATGTVSVSRLQPLHSAGYVLLPIAAFLATFVYTRTHVRYMRFAQVVIAAGFIVTVLCLGQHHLFPEMLLWERKLHYKGVFTGTFVNPNTAATFYGMLLLLSVSICARQLERIDLYRLILTSTYWSAKERARLRVFVLYAGCVATFAVALMLTRSRAGILSSIVGLAVFVSAYAFLAVAHRSSVVKAIAASAGSTLGLGLALALFGERFLHRIKIEGLIDEPRVCVYRSTWAAIEDHFWWGAGLGTFQDIFPAYRRTECGLAGYWEMAHSVYLEAWLGMGAVFFLCLTLIYYQLIKAYVVGLGRRRRFRFVPLQGLCIVLVLSLHSIVDFSLQIPGLAVVAATVLGAGASLALSKRPRKAEAATRRLPLAVA